MDYFLEAAIPWVRLKPSGQGKQKGFQPQASKLLLYFRLFQYNVGLHHLKGLL